MTPLHCPTHDMPYEFVERLSGLVILRCPACMADGLSGLMVVPAWQFRDERQLELFEVGHAKRRENEGGP